jgi:hypothetical protein
MLSKEFIVLSVFIKRSLLCLLFVMPLLLGLKNLAHADAENLPEVEQQDQLEDEAKTDHDKEPPWEFSIVPAYERGSFGLIDAANSIEIPFEIKWHSSRVEISLTVPMEIAQVDSQKRSARNRSRVSKRPEVSNWYEGIGDILLDGSVDVIEEKKYVPEVSFKGEILFPTGNADKGLGMGGFTGTLGIELSKNLLEQFAVNARFNYNRFASPDVIESENYFDYGGGIEIDITSQFKVAVDYDEMTTLVKGEGHPRSIDLTANYSINRMFEVTAGGEIGLNSAAPKFGFSSGLILHF